MPFNEIYIGNLNNNFKMKHLLFAVLLMGIFACKNDTSGNKLSSVDPSDAKGGATVDPKNLTVPSACSMITAAEVQDIVNAKNAVVVKESNDPKNQQVKSCFFKWDDPSTPNAGILVQIMTNPVYDEFPQYVSMYVESKLKEGEMAMGQETPFKYKKFEAAGIDGAYSFEQGRFYWAGDANYMFMLAFNVSAFDEDDMVDAAEDIIESIHKNFKDKVKY